MFNINYNNQNSYEDLGLAIESRPIVPIPQKNVRDIVIPGKDGSLTEDEGTYGDIEIPIKFVAVDKNNLHQSCRNIKRWLIGYMSDNKLILSDDTDHFYRVKYIKTDNIERMMIIVGMFTATFVCEPFLYLNNEELLTLTSPTAIFNPGTISSKPYIKVVGDGNIDLSINNQIVKLSSVEGYIELDSEIEECYKDLTSSNKQMIGEFQTLQPGENQISWTGNVIKIEVLTRWRWF